ncbi:hypothetical protein [uncultured Halomonas sp.]|uniref:hypothetical protein n=1 Tax=uncultured Halomonas sp. TaxID=173971 RepID=UPI002639FABB|nr:hypothetical protein [uncultured Halomonas sp.]
MSQHHYQTRDHAGDPVHVLAGWDRPLGYFFLVVERETPEGEAEEVYSNLDDGGAGLSQVASFAYYREVLARLGIEVPAAMIEAIEQDKAHGIGNRSEDWTAAEV